MDSGLLAIIETLGECNIDSIEREIAAREIDEFVLFINNERQTCNQKKKYLSFEFSYELTKYATAIANRTTRRIFDVMTYVHDESFNDLFQFHPLSHLKKTSHVYDTIRMMKTKRKFQIMLVYAKRKRIIHEGATNFDGLIHINKFLEDILRRAILNLNEFQRIKKINPLTLELNRPFKNTNSNDLLGFNM